MQEYRVLTDRDVESHMPMERAVTVMERAFVELANGTLAAPPRFRVNGPKGPLVFTAGAATGDAPVIGFRVYSAFAQTPAGEPSQLIAVFDSETGVLKGVIIGSLLGALRTAAINGVAIKRLARQDAVTLAVIGAGFQARHQVAAALAVRPFRSLAIYSRTQENALRFQQEIVARHGIAAHVCSSAQEAVADADVILCATNSRTPVIESGWVRPGTHINTIGPKTVGGHELPRDIDSISAVIATDSLSQAIGYGEPFFIDTRRLIGLDQIVIGRAPGRRTAHEVTLFCSVGLAGTEVLLADDLITHLPA